MSINCMGIISNKIYVPVCVCLSLKPKKLLWLIITHIASVGRGVASGGERVIECIGPRGLGGPRSPTGHREHRDILFE